MTTTGKMSEKAPTVTKELGEVKYFKETFSMLNDAGAASEYLVKPPVNWLRKSQEEVITRIKNGQAAELKFFRVK